jgi:hypothetical protein
MSEIVDFMKENSNMIILIVIVVLFLLVVINIKGIDLNPPKPETKLVQQVTVETLDTMDGSSMQDSKENIERMKLNLGKSFCESYLGNSSELETACNELTEMNCAQTKCCVFRKSGQNGQLEDTEQTKQLKQTDQCVAGDLHGPTYKADKDGKLITMDSYYYLGKCRGSCPLPT